MPGDFPIRAQPRPPGQRRGGARGGLAGGGAGQRLTRPRRWRDLADITAPLLAGPELSVAATKSYIGALSAIVQLVAHWSGDVSWTCSACPLARLARSARRSLGARLERGPAASAGCPEPLCAWPRRRLRRRRGGGPEAEGDLRPCTRRRSAPPRVRHGLDGAGRSRTSSVLAFAQSDESRAGVEGGAGGDAAAQGAPAIKAGGERAVGRSSPCTDPGRLPDPGADRLCAELLSPGRFAGPGAGA